MMNTVNIMLWKKELGIKVVNRMVIFIIIILLLGAASGCKQAGQKPVKPKIIGSSQYIKVVNVKVLRNNNIVISGTKKKDIKALEIPYVEDPNNNMYNGIDYKLGSGKEFQINYSFIKKPVNGIYKIKLLPNITQYNNVDNVDIEVDMVNKTIKKIQYIRVK